MVVGEMSDSDHIIWPDQHPNLWYGHTIRKRVVFSTIHASHPIEPGENLNSISNRGKLSIASGILEFFKMPRVCV